MQGIAMINLGSTTNGLILLWGLFLYDIFWVFCTPVMVAVATKLDGPIKLLFPAAAAAARKFNMLGLGDIVVPGAPRRTVCASQFHSCAGPARRALTLGREVLRLQGDSERLLCLRAGDGKKRAGLFVALMLHFDARNGSGKRYFYAAMAGYTAGLAVTIAVMNVFNAAQPALLYIVPGVCPAVCALAAARGEVKQLLAFSDEAKEEGAAVAAKGTATGGEGADGKRAGGADPAQDDVPAELRTFDAGQTAPGFEVVGELKKAK